MEMLVTKFSNGKYRNEGELFDEPISAENVKLMGEMIALQALRTVKKFDMKVADRLYIGLIKDLHHMGEIDYIVSDGYDVAQTAICFLYQLVGHSANEIYGKDCKGKEISIKLACYREVDHIGHRHAQKIRRASCRYRSALFLRVDPARKIPLLIDKIFCLICVIGNRRDRPLRLMHHDLRERNIDGVPVK